MSMSRVLFAFVLCVALSPATVPAEAGPPFSRPALVTSVGQSSDIVVVKALLVTQMKLDFTVKPVAQASDLEGMQTLVIVVGSSAKGLGAAGLDMEKEIARTRTLVAAARGRKIPILVMHTGGEARRGKTSNDLIEIVGPEADHVIVVAAGNKDRIFNRLAEKRQAQVVEVDRLAAAGAAVKTVFGQ